MENDNGKPERREKKGGMWFGVILVVLGAIFLLDNYGYAFFDFGKLWPIFLIVPGFLMIFKK